MTSGQLTFGDGRFVLEGRRLHEIAATSYLTQLLSSITAYLERYGRIISDSKIGLVPEGAVEADPALYLMTTSGAGVSVRVVITEQGHNQLIYRGIRNMDDNEDADGHCLSSNTPYDDIVHKILQEVY